MKPFHILIKTSFLFLLFTITTASIAQTGTVRGFIYEEATGEPIIFTNAYLEGTDMGASTDVNGYFIISKIPAGDYILKVTYLGYDTLRESITVEPDKIINKKLFLKAGSIQMNTVEISGEKQEAQTNVQMSVVKATPKQIKMIPSIGGQADLAQYLQVLPGVIFTGDQGGQLYIRGGSPIQNKVLLDGMVVYNPFHSIGLFSVFDTDIIRNADIYTGGFGAEFGGRISSIMDITTRDGNKKRTAGKIGVNTFGANVLIEGPIKPQTSEADGSSSYIFSAKHSFLEQSSKALYGYIDEEGLPFNYTDLYGKVSFNSNSGSKFNLFGFSYNDQVTYQALSNLQWNALGAGGNFVLVPSGNPVLIEGNFSVSDYQIILEEADFEGERKSGINSFNLGLNFKYFQGDNELKYGIDITGFGTNYSFVNFVGEKLEQDANNTELAGFFAYKFNLNNLVLDLGIRGQYFSSLRILRPEPRLGAKYNLSENIRLKAAAGLYSQNIISATSDRDVVNLFNGFLVGPENLQSDFVEEDGEITEVQHPLQTAGHLIVGAEFDLTPNINLNVEAYYKDFSQLTNINRNKLFASDQSGVDDVLRKDFIVEKGSARGVDFTLKYEKRNMYFWAVYSLGDVDRWDGIQAYDPVFDRTHNINLLASYSFGNRLLWEASVRWNYGSGFPFTQNQGFYLNETFANGLNTDITETNSAQPTTQYGELNKGRLSQYHRLDATLKRTFEFSDVSNLEINLSVTNFYNRENIFYINRVTSERVYQLPLMPSIGAIFSF